MNKLTRIIPCTVKQKKILTVLFQRISVGDGDMLHQGYAFET